jgi:hypothetical protein
MCLGKSLCSFRLTPLGVARALVFIGKPAVINGFTERCFFCVYVQKRFDIVLVCLLFWERRLELRFWDKQHEFRIDDCLAA